MYDNIGLILDADKASLVVYTAWSSHLSHHSPAPNQDDHNRSVIVSYDLKMSRNNMKLGNFLDFQTYKYKVDDFGTNRKHVCDLISVRHSNLGPILHRVGDIAGFLCS